MPLHGYWFVFFKIRILEKFSTGKSSWDFPGGPVAKTPMQGVQLLSQVQELDPTCYN